MQNEYLIIFLKANLSLYDSKGQSKDVGSTARNALALTVIVTIYEERFTYSGVHAYIILSFYMWVKLEDLMRYSHD